MVYNYTDTLFILELNGNTVLDPNPDQTSYGSYLKAYASRFGTIFGLNQKRFGLLFGSRSGSTQI